MVPYLQARYRGNLAGRVLQVVGMGPRAAHKVQIRAHVQ